MSSSELHRDCTILYNGKSPIVFCPKYRRKVLVPPMDARLKEVVIEKQAAYSYGVNEMEIMPEHVHLSLDVDPSTGIDTVVDKIKGYTAHTIPDRTGETLGKAYPWKASPASPGMKSRLASMWTRSRFIASAGWSAFVTMVGYKGAWFGCQVEKISRW